MSDNSALDGRATLVVLSNEAEFRVIQSRLGEGFQVQPAPTGATGLSAPTDSAGELVVVAPSIASEPVYAQLRQLGLPFVALSFASSEELTNSIELGALDLLSLQMGRTELGARVRRAIREHKEKALLQSLAQTDDLSGLANFRALSLRAEEEFRRAVRYGYPLSVVTLDLDHLKQLNDQYGHEVGNRAIAACARHLRSSLRESDFAARFGGDEFVVLLPHQLPSEAHAFAERFRDGLMAIRIAVPGQPQLTVGISVTIGIAGHWEGHLMRSAAELLRASDLAMYGAKQRGRNRSEVATDADLTVPQHV